MALDADALVTLAEAKAQLGIADGSNESDAYIEDAINRASDWVEVYCGRKFSLQTIVDQYFDGYGDNTLSLEPFPIITITSLYSDWNRAYGSDTALVEWNPGTQIGQYLIDKGAGVVTRIDGFSFPYGVGVVRASFTAGYTTVPGPVKQATLMLIDNWFDEHLQSAGGGAVKSETVGSYSVTYDTSGAETNSVTVRAAVEKLLDPYKYIPIGAAYRPFHTRTLMPEAWL